jgi:hypothetical protein
MVVSELITELQGLPQDAWVDAMFPEGGDAYAVIGVDTVTLNGGRVVAIVDITDNFKPGIVA